MRYTPQQQQQAPPYQHQPEDDRYNDRPNDSFTGPGNNYDDRQDDRYPDQGGQYPRDPQGGTSPRPDYYPEDSRYPQDSFSNRPPYGMPPDRGPSPSDSDRGEWVIIGLYWVII